MSITNEDRYHLQERATEVLGTKEGATLMELLPPVGWADVATKRDLDHLGERVDLQFDQFEERMDLQCDKVEESMDLRFDATVANFRADLAESGRRMHAVVLTAIVAATSILAALSVFGPN